MNTVHQTLTAQMFAKTICRKCGGLFEAAQHDFAECDSNRLTKNARWHADNDAAAMRQQLQTQDLGAQA